MSNPNPTFGAPRVPTPTPKLLCPHCQHRFPVSGAVRHFYPGDTNDTLRCPLCKTVVNIPKLRQPANIQEAMQGVADAIVKFYQESPKSFSLLQDYLLVQSLQLNPIPSQT